MKKQFKVRDLLSLKSVVYCRNGICLASTNVSLRDDIPDVNSFKTLRFGRALPNADADEYCDLFDFLMSLHWLSNTPADMTIDSISLEQLMDMLENYLPRPIAEDNDNAYDFNTIMNSNVASIQIYHDNLCVLVEKPDVVFDFDGTKHCGFNAIKMIQKTSLCKFPQALHDDGCVNIGSLHTLFASYYKLFDAYYTNNTEIKIDNNFTLLYTRREDKSTTFNGFEALIHLNADGFFEDNGLIKADV